MNAYSLPTHDTPIRNRKRDRLVNGVSLLTLTAMVVTGCGPSNAADTSSEVVLVTHDSFNVSKDVLTAFEKESGLKVVIKTVGDAGTMANQLVFTKDAPLGDVTFGIDNTYASRVLDDSVLQKYNTPATPNGAQQYDADKSSRLHPVDHSAVCVNYDRQYFTDRQIPPPVTIHDLTQPQYRDLLVVQNPATSSPGLAFLLGTIADQGEEGYLDYWSKLTANGVKVTDDWTTAYSVDFSGSSGKGPRPLVVSYASSPYIEIPEGETQSPTAVANETCFEQIEYAGILAGARHLENAKKLIDFMMSEQFQNDIPEQMYMYPVSAEATLPRLWSETEPAKTTPLTLAPEIIDNGREMWVKAWAEMVLG